MNADKIVKALRRMAENSRSKHDVLVASADLIESLQAQLAESQRRERAAVEFIKYLDRNYSGYMAEDERFAEWRGPQEAGTGKGEAK